VEAALALFDERGISATGIADIQTRANVSVGSIYHHFGDKEGVAGDVFLSVLAEYQREFCSAVPADAEAERGIRAGVRAHLRWTSANQPNARYLATFHKRSLDPERAERLRELNERLYDHVESWWALRAASGALVAAKLPLSYALWLGPAQELCRLWLATPAPAPGRLERFSAPLCDGAWKAVRAA
jgi:AcrR family transcriptional regulator